jgi:Domain of unknown function (DUF5624)
MSYQPHAAFAGLFRAFTSDPRSIGARLTQQMDQLHASDPLIVSSGSDIVLFPGNGRAPSIASFRKSTRGFIELTAVSHLPLALAYLARMRELNPHDDAWRDDATNLIAHADAARAANSVELWRDEIAVGSLAGHERKIANLVDYTCGASIEMLRRSLDDPTLLTFDRLLDEFFEPVPAVPPAPGAVGIRGTVPMNDVMFATFGLAFLDIVYRIGNWLRAQPIDWQRTMVLVSGQSGRPTAGVTSATNNMCYLLWRASESVLPPEHIFVAPHAPTFSVAPMPDDADIGGLEQTYRGIWLNTRASVDVARKLFPDQPAWRFEPPRAEDMPPITSVDDRAAAKARLRRIMEDPTQLLSNCVADYIVDSLHANGNDPHKVEIPGFSNIEYPQTFSAG